MKKLLLSTAAVGLAFSATPALADIDLELGGYFKGYGAYVDQDENASATTEVNDFDFIRDTEIHIGGETTLDSGLTVGFHIEADVDGTTSTGNDSFEVDESYAYFSGGWGRANFGDEDGAAYLLQVAAPSADSNIDGIRQYVQPVNYGAEGLAALTTSVTGGGLDYDDDVTGKSTKLTYLSPIMNGFQAGLTYTPDSDTAADDLEGVGFDDVDDALGQSYEAALRYEGQFNNVGVIFGAGYTYQELENEDVDTALDQTDDRTSYNVGLDLDFGPFGLGAIYKEDDFGEQDIDGAVGGATVDDEETIVIGADYTTGPFKLGISYFDQENVGGVNEIDAERYSAGVVYTYGPGMTFRGSVGYVELEDDLAGSTRFGTEDDTEATYVTLGTQINF